MRESLSTPLNRHVAVILICISFGCRKCAGTAPYLRPWEKEFLAPDFDEEAELPTPSFDSVVSCAELLDNFWRTACVFGIDRYELRRVYPQWLICRIDEIVERKKRRW